MSETFGDFIVRIGEAVRSLEQCVTPGEPYSLFLEPYSLTLSECHTVEITLTQDDERQFRTALSIPNLGTYGWSVYGELNMLSSGLPPTSSARESLPQKSED
jgi:hypothetical protein